MLSVRFNVGNCCSIHAAPVKGRWESVLLIQLPLEEYVLKPASSMGSGSQQNISQSSTFLFNSTHNTNIRRSWGLDLFKMKTFQNAETWKFWSHKNWFHILKILNLYIILDFLWHMFKEKLVNPQACQLHPAVVH